MYRIILMISFLEGNTQKKSNAQNAAWEDIANADNITLELSAFYKMLKR